MTFVKNHCNVFLNVDEIFEVATDEDYMDDLDAIGVIVRTLTKYKMFDGCIVILFYHESDDSISIEVCSGDDYCIIKDIVILPKEKERVRKELAA